MKQNVFRALLATAILLSLAGVGSLFADENTVNLESRVIQDFSKPEAQNWFVLGSKFSTGDFPHYGFANVWPAAIYGVNSQVKDAKSLGVAMLFNRKEYNWVDVAPGTPDKPKELPMPGRVKMIDMWVWSGNFDYYMEAFVRDFKGIVHVIPMGNLSFVGWKNLRVNVPETIPQSKKYLPKGEPLKLVKFRIWTRPTEVVMIPGTQGMKELDMAVKFYFHNIKVLTDTFEALYDGDNATSPDIYKDLSIGTKK
jgi:hypothetical protein